MKINVVTGGTGFIGRYLVQSLLEKGQIVWVVIRHSNETSEEKFEKVFSRFTKKYKNQLRLIQGDVLKSNLGIDKDILKFFSGEEITIWHLAANLSFRLHEKESVLQTNIEGTMHIVELANRIGKRLLFVSTAYVSGDRKYFREDELEAHQRHRNTYEKSKYEAEKIIRSDCKIPYLIFRPSIVIGDAYKGKAVGCTFGYYRYIFLFFLMRTWIIRLLQNRKSFRGTILRLLNTTYNSQKDELSIPWLYLPFPKNSIPDLIPVDYLIESLIHLSNSEAPSKTVFHLTNPDPPSYEFLLYLWLDELNVKKVKPVAIPQFLFVHLFHLSYFCFPSLKTYIQSLMWYLPYMTYRTHFSQKNVKTYNTVKMPPLDKKFMKRVNVYAKQEVFQHITIE